MVEEEEQQLGYSHFCEDYENVTKEFEGSEEHAIAPAIDCDEGRAADKYGREVR